MSNIIYTNRVYLQLVRPPCLHNKLNDGSGGVPQDNWMDFKVESGRRLKLAREMKGWTLKELSAQVQGVSESRISNYEQGLRLMRQPEAIKLAIPLGISAAYLMCVDEGSCLHPRAKRLLDIFESSDSRGKLTIEQAAEGQAALNVKPLPHLRPARTA